MDRNQERFEKFGKGNNYIRAWSELKKWENGDSPIYSCVQRYMSHFCAYVMFPKYMEQFANSAEYYSNQGFTWPCDYENNYDFENESDAKELPNEFSIPGYYCLGWDYAHFGDECKNIDDVNQDIENVVNEFIRLSKVISGRE